MLHRKGSKYFVRLPQGDTTFLKLELKKAKNDILATLNDGMPYSHLH